MRVTVIGVGALGSHVIQFLRNEHTNLRVIDFDRVEARNVASQFHLKGCIGKRKTEALRQAMQFCFGAPPLEVVGSKLGRENVQELLGQAGLLVDCLDNAAGRKLVQDFARAHQTPCLHGALAADGAFGRVVWDEHYVIDDEQNAATPTCQDGAFLPFIAITAAYVAYAAQRFIRSGRKDGFQISPGSTEKI